MVGNRVILFNRSVSGGNGDGRASIREALLRLSTRYGFTATVTEDPKVFTAANLADAKVVIMSNGDGDVVPPGAERAALENFQLVNGWGLIWIHAACSFITSGWPFGQKSCVQQYFHHNGSGTTRRIFIDSGTSASPNHGIKNPQSEFLLRNLPGWGASRVLQMADEWFCFRRPARDSAGVNVLFGYDRSSGLPPGDCPNPTDTTEAGSQGHNLAWTHRMGRGITVFNSWGHDRGTYTGNFGIGDSLLWRYIRYAAKDWCVGGSGEPGCDLPLPIRGIQSLSATPPLALNGTVSLSLPAPGRFAAVLLDLAGRPLASRILHGPGKLEIPGLRRGFYLLQVVGAGARRTYRIEMP